MTPNSQDLAYLRANPDVADKFDARFGEGAAARYSAAAPASVEPTPIAPGGEPTQRDVDYLRANPGVADKFNTRFGENAAAGYLSQVPSEAPQVTPAAVSPTPAPAAAPEAAPAEATPEETSPGILGTLGDMAQGLLHGGQEAINETVQTAESISDAVSEKAGEYGIPTTVQLFNDAGEFDPALLTHQEMKEQGLGTILGGQPNVDDAGQIEAVKHPITAFGTATSAVSQFLVGYAGASRVTGVRGMVGGFLNGAITDATVFDPDDDNLSAFMEKTGYAVPLLSEALATDPESPEWLNRMRNAAEGVILGGITETAFKGFRAIALARKAKETGSEELATEATRLADEAAAEGEDALANGVPVDGPPPLETFKGTMNLRHGYHADAPTSFERDFAGDRNYPGSVFGDTNRVYLDGDGSWTRGEVPRYSTKGTITADADFDNALVVTPDNIAEIAKRIGVKAPGPAPRRDRVGDPKNEAYLTAIEAWNKSLLSGDKLSNWAEQQGHDGLIVTGFNGNLPHEPWVPGRSLAEEDAAELRFAENVLDWHGKTGASDEITQDQVVSFRPERIRPGAEVDPASSFAGVREQLDRARAPAPDAPTEPAVTPLTPPLVNEQALRAALADTDKVTLGQLDDSMWFNMDKMDGPLEAQVMIETVGDALARSGALEKLGIDQPETFASVLKGAKEELAGMIGTGVDEFTARVAKVSAVAGEQSKFLVAGKMALQTTGREISRYATRVDAMAKLGKVDPEVEAKLLDLMTTHANLQGHLKAVQTAAARATSAGRIVTNDGLDAKALSALERVNAVGGSKVVREMAGKLAAAGGPTQQAKLIRAMNRKGSGPMRVINEVFINSILSGWGTHAVNMASNTLNTVLLPAERVIGGALTRNLDQTRMGLQQYAEFRSAVVDGIRMMGRVLRTENPVLDTEVKLDMQREGFKAISSSGTGPTAALINGIGQIIRLPGRALMAEDEFFKQITFRSRLMANLTVTSDSLTPAQLKKMGYANKGAFIEGEAEKAVMGLQDLEDRWEELVLKGRVTNDPKVRQQFLQQNIGAANGASKYAQDALRVAREVTFTTPLDPNTVSAGWQRMANRHPALRQITPFIQTPVNILNKAFDRTPGLNLLRTRYRDRLKSADPAVRAEAAGEMATGVAISTALFMLAHEGRITGGGPADPAKRANWMRDKNWQPYSINLGTSEEPQWVEYKRLDPFFFTFGVAGDVAEMMQASQNDPSFDSATLLTMVVGSTFNTLASKTWLQGIADVVEMVSSKDQPQVIQRWFAQRAASMIPLSNAGRTYNRDTDEVSREVRSFIDQVKIRTPGMGSDLPARHDWLTGEEIENPTQLLGFLRVQHGERDTVAQELRRLNYGFAGPDRKIGRISLSSEQFQDWNRMMGTVRLGGRSLHQALERAMQSNHYDLSRDRVPDGVTTSSESHRTKVIAPIIAAYKQAARAELFGKYPDLQDAWRRYEVFKGRAGAGQVQQGERENLLLKF